MKTALQEISALKPAQVGEIERIYESFGTGRDGIHRVSRTFHVAEAPRRPWRPPFRPRQSPSPNPAPDATATAAALDADASRKAALAHRLHQQVNEAEARIEVRGQYGGALPPRSMTVPRRRGRRRSRHVRMSQVLPCGEGLRLALVGGAAVHADRR